MYLQKLKQRTFQFAVRETDYYLQLVTEVLCGGECQKSILSTSKVNRSRVCTVVNCVYSYYLWSISELGKTGTPSINLTDDPEAQVANCDKHTCLKLAHERIITKIFTHYVIPLEITDGIRATFKAKLWRMGKRFSTLGGQQRPLQLSQWQNGPDANWMFTINEMEVNNQSLLRKRKVEAHLHEESHKCKKLESEVKMLHQKTEKQIARLKSGQSERTRKSSKSWTQYSRQQQHNRKKQLASDIQGALSFCKEDGFKPYSIEVENTETGKHEVIDYSTGTCYSKENILPSNMDKVHSALYVKDKYALSDNAFHELTMISSDLPKSNQVKKLAHEMSNKFHIHNAPDGVVDIQQSLKARITIRLRHLIERGRKIGKEIPTCFRIKLTGDGTQIARGLSVVNFTFTILEEENLALSVKGNHSVAILRVSENYDDLLQGLHDIIAEAEDIEMITINDVSYQIQLFLGGDWKFLAL